MHFCKKRFSGMNLFLIVEFFYFLFSFKRRQFFCILIHRKICWFVPYLQTGEKITEEKELIRDLSRDRQVWVILNLWHKTMVTCQGICYDECLAGFPGPQEAITSVTSQLNRLNTFLKIFFFLPTLQNFCITAILSELNSTTKHGLSGLMN